MRRLTILLLLLTGCARYSMTVVTNADGSTVRKEEAMAFLSGDINLSEEPDGTRSLEVHKESKVSDVLTVAAPFIPLVIDAFQKPGPVE